MRPISSVFATIVTIILLNAQAFATTATWVVGDGWNVLGDSEIGYCRLNVQYERDDLLAVMAGNLKGGPSMGVSSRNLRPLIQNAEAVEASLRFSNDEFYRLVAEVLGEDLVIANVPVEAVLDFANTAWMELRVRGLLVGTYSLDGTSNMVSELTACIQSMRGDPA